MGEQPVASLIEDDFPGEWGDQDAGEGLREAFVLRATNFIDGGLDYSGGARRFIPQSKVARKRLQRGDLVLEAAGGGPGVPVGRVARFDPPDDRLYVVSNFFRTLRPAQGTDPRFTCHVLDHLYRQPRIWEVQQQTTGIINLKVRDYLQIPVPVPPLQEQRRIAEILDTIDETIQATERVIAKLRVSTDGLRNAMIDEQDILRGCERLDRMIRVIDCKHYTPRYTPSGYPVVRPRNVKPGRLDFGDIEFVGDSEFAILTDSHRPGRGDIVMSRNASFGAAALVDFDQPFAIGQDVVVLSPTTANSKYIEACLRSDHVQRQIAAVSGGSTFGRINLGDIRQLEIPAALADDQETVAETLTAAEQAVSTELALVEKLKQQRAGLAVDLLSGRVRTVAA